MRVLNVLIGCEESGTIREAFRKLGHNAWSCDLKPARDGSKYHYQCDVFEIIKSQSWDIGIFHPTCTYLTITANKWLKDQPERKSGALVGMERRLAQQEAIEFFKKFWYIDTIPHICIENPVGVMSNWRLPNQIIQPFMFGHSEPKKTCLWLRDLPLLKHTEIVEPEYHTTKSGKRLPKWYAYADKSEGQEKRAEIRSKTFQGIADAMAIQYSNYILNESKQLSIKF